MSLPTEPSSESSSAAVQLFVTTAPSAATSFAPMTWGFGQAGQSLPSATYVPSSLVVTSASYLVVEGACRLAFTPFAQELPASLVCPHLVRLTVHPYSIASHLVLVFRFLEPHLPSSLPLIHIIYPY